MDLVLHFIQFGELKYVYMLIYHIISTCSEFQWSFVLSFEGDESEIKYLLEIMALLEIPIQHKTHDILTYMPIKIYQFNEHEAYCRDSISHTCKVIIKKTHKRTVN